ncbi:M23 family metallopeptidase [Dokdonia ponticola]|uniref:M23 family metallopeptidase n=1 Tax=Dokdonia ponticola TaxID=2041041 RepID=A0ABV9I240_9FLAO
MRFSLFLCLIPVWCFGQQIKLKSIKKYQNDTLYVGVRNQSPIPIWYEALKKDTVDYSSQRFDLAVIQPKDSIYPIAIIPVSAIKDTSDISLKEYINYRFIRANPRAKHDDSYAYELPYAKGKKYEVIQTHGQSFSHNTPTSRYAVDFKMPIGTPIHAIRGGIVVLVTEHNTEHGGRDFIDKSNNIFILHSDGTYAQYAHLDYNGADVEVGDVIQQGAYIGRSGHTGFSTRPHLHLVVKDGNGISLPFYFNIRPKKKLKSGKKYLRK